MQSAETISAAYDFDLAARDQSLAVEFLCTVAGDFSERCDNIIPSLGGRTNAVKACLHSADGQEQSAQLCRVLPD